MEEGGLLLSIMLKQDEVAFINALSSIQLTPVLLRELRKTMAVGKKRKASGAKAARVSALEGASGSRKSPPSVRSLVGWMARQRWKERKSAGTWYKQPPCVTVRETVIRYWRLNREQRCDVMGVSPHIYLWILSTILTPACTYTANIYPKSSHDWLL